jgi:hypothetical protein
MHDSAFAREIATYVALALAIVGTAQSATAQSGLELPTFDPSGEMAATEQFPVTIGGLRDKELSSIETLVQKYREVEKFIPGGGSLGKLEFVKRDMGEGVWDDAVPIGIDPRVAAVSREQFETAQKVHDYVDRISAAMAEGNDGSAKETYQELARFVEAERTALYGNFESYQQMSEVLGAYSEGRGADTLAVGGGAIIFVIIEIYVS